MRVTQWSIVAAVAMPVMVTACAATRGGPPRGEELASGRVVFDETCAVCHSITPPPRAAPPMSHIARHYLDGATDTAAVVRRIERWIAAPAAEASALPAHAVERWGLMPPQQLSSAQRRAVAQYVVTLAAPQGQQPGMGGMGMRQRGMQGMPAGGGMQHRHGRTPATGAGS